MISRYLHLTCRSTEGLTPVHVAACWGRFQALEVLLWNGGDPSVEDEEGKTPITMADANSHWDCIDLLEKWMRSQDCDEEEDEERGGSEEEDEEEREQEDSDFERVDASEQDEQYLSRHHYLEGK